MRGFGVSSRLLPLSKNCDAKRSINFRSVGPTGVATHLERNSPHPAPRQTSFAIGQPNGSSAPGTQRFLGPITGSAVQSDHRSSHSLSAARCRYRGLGGSGFGVAPLSLFLMRPRRSVAQMLNRVAIGACLQVACPGVEPGPSGSALTRPGPVSYSDVGFCDVLRSRRWSSRDARVVCCDYLNRRTEPL